MTAVLLALVPEYGAALVLVATFLSCLALPVPSSLIMLAAGAFVASGDLSAEVVVTAALTGALLGDQFGFWIGRAGGPMIKAKLWHQPATARMLARAEARLQKHDLLAVYLTRWLFSPLGPYVNLLGGVTQMKWLRFTFADIAGEATWVALYVGLGIGFASWVEAMGATLGNLVGAMTTGLLAWLLGRALWHKAHENGRD
ncbi:MAG: DedA family protein [Pseudorhodobacter sp.]|nr:DedA family protein [Pseudorhodobacter sp.]